MSLLSAFGATFTVTRYNATTRVKGKRVAPTVQATLSVFASIQRMSAKEVLQLPEGDRVRDPIKIYTETELFVVNEQAGTESDRISYQGRAYELQKVERWDVVIPHFKAIALRVEADE